MSKWLEPVENEILFFVHFLHFALLMKRNIGKQWLHFLVQSEDGMLNALLHHSACGPAHLIPNAKELSCFQEEKVKTEGQSTLKGNKLQKVAVSK